MDAESRRCRFGELSRGLPEPGSVAAFAVLQELRCTRRSSDGPALAVDRLLLQRAHDQLYRRTAPAVFLEASRTRGSIIDHQPLSVLAAVLRRDSNVLSSPEAGSLKVGVISNSHPPPGVCRSVPTSTSLRSSKRTDSRPPSVTASLCRSPRTCCSPSGPVLPRRTEIAVYTAPDDLEGGL